MSLTDTLLPGARVALFCLLALQACSPDVGDQPATEGTTIQPPAAVAEENRAELEWQRHITSLEAAVTGGVHDESFEEACQFFERVTGEPVRGNGSPFGWLPNEATRSDLDSLRAWYSANHSRLYWDEATKTVKVRSPST